MPIHIDVDISGRLILDVNNETDILTNPDFEDILISFNVVSHTPHSVLIDVGSDLIGSLEYLQRSFDFIGVTMTLCDELRQILEKARFEIKLINDIRISSSRPKRKTVENVIEVPSLVNSASLLSHQKRGLIKGLSVNNLAEFSVQGSGKTAIVLSAFSIWKNKGELDKLLVIGPVSCFEPWENETKRCFKNAFKTMRWSGAVSQRLKLVPEFALVDIILCSYDTGRRDVLMLRRLMKDSRTLLVLDESHYIKNINIGARGSAAIQLAQYASKRMILTGTPAPHSMQDLWSQFTFLWPNGSRKLLGNVTEYQDFLFSSRSPARELRQRLGPFYHRTTQEELHLPLADSHFISIHANNIPDEQKRIIKLLETRVSAEARLQLPQISDRKILAQWQRARVTRLLQASSNPGLLHSPPEWSSELVGDIDTSGLLEDVIKFQTGELTAAKITWTINKIKELISKGEKVLIWTWWVTNLHLLKDLLIEYNPLLIYGEIKPYEDEADSENEQSREKNIRDFKTRNDRPILIANPSACAEAISLHMQCHHAIYVDRTFNCGQFLQSLNRIHRVGLPQGVVTHYWIPIIECAIEHVVDTRLRDRQQVMYEFLGDNSPVIGIDANEENEITDNNEELNRNFKEIIKEIDANYGDKNVS